MPESPSDGLGSLLRPRPNVLFHPRARAEIRIAEKHAALNGAPAAKVGDLQVTREDTQGYVQRYEHGAIYWQNDIGAFWVLGAIHDKYVALGGATGFLGHPLNDETPTVDGIGRFNHFEGGSIYWHPSIGAFEVHGGIRECFKALGWEAYGYPITDETSTPSGRGRFNHFRQFHADGFAPEVSIYWSPESGAHAIYGAIRDRWFELGEEQSYLGFPTTDELEWTDPDTQLPGRISHFERGAIGWIADGGELVEFPARHVFRSGHIGVSSVGGWVELTITSAGSFHYRGHLHNSGFVGIFCTAAVAVKIPGTSSALGAKYEANVGGTTSVLDSRDEDWQERGFDPNIRTHWDVLVGAPWQATLDTELGGWEVVTMILLPILGAVLLISLVSGSSGRDTVCETTVGSHVVHDGNNRSLVEPDGVRCRRP